ncbi:type VI secretion system-associated protein TagF [Pseudoduganella lurida]|uniref:type VI secretion system-associated protein TagF n=1 Tax=Pseudoduganella lurida TaxID=1036180 RepID=UPI0011A263FA|nr:type VI secretion system-associated protein TagF [Pseudoduganella lurida]
MTAPGFHGKLRHHGDFVTRRLPPAMLQPFDAWLQAALVRSRAALGEAWLPAYLNGPLWRFVLAPGVCGPQAWAGVMMPSADRVGRAFPLTIAAGLDGAPSLHDCLVAHAGWFGQVEDLALSTLEDAFSLAAFDAQMGVLAGAPRPGGMTAAPAAGLQVGALADGVLTAIAHEGIAGCSAWWTEGAERVAPCLARCPGLPPPAAFAALLDGCWQAHGWSVAGS